MSSYHRPVLLDRSLSSLVVSPDGVYVDATLGGGGHTSALLSRLSPKGKVIAFDLDKDAISAAPEDPRLRIVRSNYRYAADYVRFLRDFTGTERVDGVLADLGVSSHQFDTPERGFSFRFDSPLDMRMNPEGGITAQDIVNTYTQEDLEKVLRTWGEVDNPQRAAMLITKRRDSSPILTTGQLSEALAPMLPKGAEHKVLAKVFQALRIEVNGEMRSLEKFLLSTPRMIKEGGRLVVITYHSLEDRMVKNFMKTGSISGEVRRDFYGKSLSPFKVVEKKPVLPSEEEISSNTRARSAKMRVAERVHDDQDNDDNFNTTYR